MAKIVKIYWKMSNFGQVYGQKCPDLVLNEILCVAMVIVSLLDSTPMASVHQNIVQNYIKKGYQSYDNRGK